MGNHTDVYALRRSTRPSNGRVSAGAENLPQAEFVGYGYKFETSGRPFDTWPHPVVLKFAHGTPRGVLPGSLVGRIVARAGETVDVWFRRRGVFRLPTPAVRIG